MNKPEEITPSSIPIQDNIPYGYYLQEDEASLADLWQILVKQKKTLFTLAALTLITALIYALVATPVYRAEAIFLPPAEIDIQLFDVSNIQDVSVEYAYGKFRKNLQSMVPRRIVFEKMDLLEHLASDQNQDSSIDSVFRTFNKSLFVSSPKKNNSDLNNQLPIITLSMEGENPALIADITNRLAEEVGRVSTTEIISGIQAKVNARIRGLIQEINLLQEKTRRQRLDKIERLETADTLEINNITDKILALRSTEKQKHLANTESLLDAAKIARSLEIKEPLFYAPNKIDSPNNSRLKTSESLPELRLYTHGYDALEAEIKILSNRKVEDHLIPEIRVLNERLALLEQNREVEQLKSRKSDDPFIDDLRDKESELAYLELISIDPKTVKTALIDQAAFPSKQRIKPRRKLIVGIGLVLGLMLGIFGALFVHFLETQRKQKEALFKS